MSDDKKGITMVLGVVTSHEEALPIRAIKGSAVMTVSAVGTVTPAETDADWPHKVCPRIAMPPGYLMDRLGRWIFFFSPRGRRVVEETVDDYRHETIEAEAKGASKHELRKLCAQHWGRFFLTVLEEFATGIGKIIKILKGG